MSESNVVPMAQLAPVPVAADPLLALIERAARDPSVDIDKMQRLFEMHEKLEARRAEQQFNAGMSSVQAKLQPVARKAWNPHTKSKYAALDAIYDACKPVITAHGFGTSFGMCTAGKPGHIKLVCDVTHQGGFSKRYESDDIPLDGAGFKGNANKTDVQAMGSTLSYGRRYMTLLIFDIATFDDKDGSRRTTAPTEAVISEKQALQLRDMIEATETHVDKLCAFYKIDALPDLPASKFAHAMEQLSKRLPK